jgi:hypothetical protein
LHRYEEEKRMPYVTSVERLAKEEGRKEELLEVIEAGLQGKFGRAGLKLLPKIRALKNNAQLRDVAKTLMTADSLDAIRELVS